MFEIPDDPARAAPPGHAWLDRPLEEDEGDFPVCEDEPLYDEAGTILAGAGWPR